MKKSFYPILLLLFCTTWLSAQKQPLPSSAGEVLIFLQGKEPAWLMKDLDSLQSYLLSEQIPTRFIRMDKRGLPSMIAYTPFILYQDPRGRAVYQGRYTTKERVKSFVRTVRLYMPKSEAYEQTNVYAFKQGRANVFLYLKITALSGQLPADFNQTIFEVKALEALVKGFKLFTFFPKLQKTASDLSFYFDLHPFVDDRGNFALSYEIFSQYDCITPIFSNRAKPIKGAWNNYAASFTKAGRALEQELNKLMTTTQTGDARWTLAENILAPDWADLNLQLPSGFKGYRIFNFDPEGRSSLPELPKTWEFLGSIDNQLPAISFHFPPPLVSYGGEAKQIKGQMQLAQGQSLRGAKGSFQVQVGSVTMGIEELDHKLHEVMFQTQKYPSASLEFDSLKGGIELDLQIGRLNIVQVPATFELKGRKVKVMAPTEFEPVLDEQDQLRLYVRSFFRLEQLNEVFGLELPPGPKDANNSLIFHLQFLMKPAD